MVLQRREFAAKLPELLPRAVAWAAQQSHLILQSGAPLDDVGLALGSATRGLTLGYGIFIRQGELDLTLLSHECRHVHRVEVAGSLEAFVPAYLRQIADFGSDHAPYELDARAHEVDSLPST